MALAATVLLCACSGSDPVAKVYVIDSEEETGGGQYLKPSPDGEAVADVDGNLLEFIMPCISDVRVVHWEGVTDGGIPTQFWIPAEQWEDSDRRTCVQGLLPSHARIRGPFAVEALIAKRGMP
jgi:hypothetical protein